jgi:hypothetical protein
MGLECKRNTGGGCSMEDRGEMERVGSEEDEICYLYMNGASTKKPTKYCF